MLKKFGTTLTSRQLGKESFSAFRPHLAELNDIEKLEIDFEGVSSLSPSWGDEFLTPLVKQFKNRLVLFNTKNLSVDATISFLSDISGEKFNRKS